MTAHHKISPHEKGGAKLYMAVNMYTHTNTCPIVVQAYENKTQHILNKTIVNEPVCVCVTNSNYKR
jgi:hypothetical protein